MRHWTYIQSLISTSFFKDSCLIPHFTPTLYIVEHFINLLLWRCGIKIKFLHFFLEGQISVVNEDSHDIISGNSYSMSIWHKRQIIRVSLISKSYAVVELHCSWHKYLVIALGVWMREATFVTNAVAQLETNGYQ